MKKKWKNMSENKKNIIEIIIAITVLVVFIALRLFINFRNAQKEVAISSEKRLVTDNSRYFTALACAKKYITYVQNGDLNNILLILNEEYKERYNVNANNLNNFIPVLDKSLIYDYVGREMYEKRISKNVVEYYINGRIKTNILDESPVYTDYNLTVILYEDKLLYSIKPGVE